MGEKDLIITSELASVVDEIKTVMETALSNVARQVNSELLNTYWNIGRIICEYEQTNPDRADYGKRTLKELAKILTEEAGKGFSRANIYNMRVFYLTCEKIKTLLCLKDCFFPVEIQTRNK